MASRQIYQAMYLLGKIFPRRQDILEVLRDNQQEFCLDVRAKSFARSSLLLTGHFDGNLLCEPQILTSDFAMGGHSRVFFFSFFFSGRGSKGRS